MELRIHAAELPCPLVPVALLHLDAAHRQRCPCGAHRSETLAVPFCFTQHLQVDLGAVHLLHAADVRVPELLEGVQEGTCAIDAGGWIDDLVAVDLTAPAFELILWSERELGYRGGRDALRL